MATATAKELRRMAASLRGARSCSVQYPDLLARKRQEAMAMLTRAEQALVSMARRANEAAEANYYDEGDQRVFRLVPMTAAYRAALDELRKELEAQ